MKRWFTVICMIFVLTITACGRNETADLNQYSSSDVEGFRTIVLGDKVFVPYTAVDNTDRGKQIGIVDGDPKDQIFEYKEHSTDEWIIEYYKSGEMDGSMLCREQRVDEFDVSAEPDHDAVPDAGVAAETDAASAARSEASIRGPYGTITVELAENWNYTASAVDEEKLNYGLYGLILKPNQVSEGQIELTCIDSFGVCGTGLSEEDMILGGKNVHVGTYDDHEHWDFISFNDSRPQIVAQRIGGDTWTDDMWEEALLMMDTVRFDTNSAAGGIGQYTPESENDTIAVAMDVKHVTPSGLIVHFRQYDKRDLGELHYGEGYKLEKLEGDVWSGVPEIIDNAGFNDIAYIIPKEGESELETDWEWLYGKLSPGTYRINKTVDNSRENGYTQYPLSARFLIAGDATTNGTIAAYNTSEKTVSLEDEDISLIRDLWNNGNWNTEGTSEGLSDCVIMIDGEKVLYNSETGVFNDTINQRFMILDTATKDRLNNCLSKYITLGEFD